MMCIPLLSYVHTSIRSWMAGRKAGIQWVSQVTHVYYSWLFSTGAILIPLTLGLASASACWRECLQAKTESIDYAFPELEVSLYKPRYSNRAVT